MTVSKHKRAPGSSHDTESKEVPNYILRVVLSQVRIYLLVHLQPVGLDSASVTLCICLSASLMNRTVPFNKTLLPVAGADIE